MFKEKISKTLEITAHYVLSLSSILNYNLTKSTTDKSIYYLFISNQIK